MAVCKPAPGLGHKWIIASLQWHKSIPLLKRLSASVAVKACVSNHSSYKTIIVITWTILIKISPLYTLCYQHADLWFINLICFVFVSSWSSLLNKWYPYISLSWYLTGSLRLIRLYVSSGNGRYLYHVRVREPCALNGIPYTYYLKPIATIKTTRSGLLPIVELVCGTLSCDPPIEWSVFLWCWPEESEDTFRDCRAPNLRSEIFCDSMKIGVLTQYILKDIIRVFHLTQPIPCLLMNNIKSDRWSLLKCEDINTKATACFLLCNRDGINILQRTSGTHKVSYIYIYIYVCVCVCVCSAVAL